MDKMLILEKLSTHLKSLQKYPLRVITHDTNQEWVAQICTLIGIPKEGVEICKEILLRKPPMKLVWLHMAECTGCSESLLRLDKPGIDSLIFEYMSLDYHETIMGACGFGAKKSLQDACKEDFILVIEGGVSLGKDAYFMTSGADSVTGETECKHIAQKAQAIFAVGTCSSFGGVQAAFPNPTRSVGIKEFLSKPVVNIPGCPPSEANIIGSIFYYILLQEIPPLDRLNRPLWSYGKNLHDMCERKAKFESGDFAQSFDDPNLENAYCLYKVGCKGPYVFNNCPKIKFNAKTSWPVRAGHGCIACSEPYFWDSFGRIEEPLNNAKAYIKELPTLQTLRRIDKLDDQPMAQTLCLELCYDAPTKIYTQDSCKQFLNLQFESNLSTLLTQIASKNKLGAKLIKNYEQYLQSHQMSIADSHSRISHNFSDIFVVVNAMFGGKISWTQECKEQFLQYAQNYLFPHVSQLDFKVIHTDADTMGIEIERSLRLPLCYLLGGLEIEGMAYSVVSSMCEILSRALVEVCQQENLKRVAFKGDLMENLLIQDRFVAYLPQWLEVV
ncbi:Ni/Fe hydrogenase [Helicobacter sp. MIT 05-5293]|uniref:hydrogenase small subunit n=1 Tax=Helicobacter sp. MIT 05-5293 TaxID=1548149 RepID=UPI00051E05E2|nr:hydrogenase small subunit [Helicobacter sp. MIT 05-5293]TLD80557.1 Ni/Fe hydrogenase [Helicobacter sp. MIT 05-5293]